MNAASKEKISRDNARSHSAKSDRVKASVIVESSLKTHSLKRGDELIVCISFHIMITNLRNGTIDRDMVPPHRVCPSKLTKQELEDLYFVLMDTNLDLKKTVNTQQDNIKQLNTKVHRLLTAQKGTSKDVCCPQTKAVVNEQKDIIADLKKANDRMSERIRILNMRLCSAKQFLRTNPSLTTRCAKCCIAPPASLKNSSVSVLHKKSDDYKSVESCSRDAEKQVLTRDYASTRTTETETDEPEKESLEASCKEKKYKTQLEELKHKIIDLQEESTRHHSECSARMSRLETELQLRAEGEARLADQLRAAAAHCYEISAQLLIEKNKVAELETRVKAADLSGQVVKALEKRQSIAFVTPDLQTKSGGVALKEIESRPSTSTCIIHTQDKHPKNFIMTNELEKRLSATSTPGQNVQSKSSDIVDRDGHSRYLKSFGETQDAQEKSGENKTRDGEKRQSISFLMDPNEQAKNDDIMNMDRKSSIHLNGTAPVIGERSVSGQERRQSVCSREMVPERTYSMAGNLKVGEEPVTQDYPGPKPCPSGAPDAPSPAKSKHSDDSGYNDNLTSEEERVLAKINAELVKKIKDLQEKLDVLRIASAGIKAGQMTKATETKKADVDPRVNDCVRNERVANDAKPQINSKEGTVQSVENERRKETPEQPSKEMESGTEYSPIDRANQLWAQYSGNEFPQKEDKIQFSNLYIQGNSIDKFVPTTSEAEPDRDSMTSRSSKKKRKKFLDEKNFDTQNELVDKIETDDQRSYKDSREYFPFYEFKNVKSQGIIQDDKDGDLFTPGNDKPTDDLKQDSNTQTGAKTGIKIQASDRYVQEVYKPTEYLKQDLNMQTDLKTGVKIQDNDVFKPGVDKRVPIARPRESILDQAARDSIKEVRELHGKQQSSNKIRDSSVDSSDENGLKPTSVEANSITWIKRRATSSNEAYSHFHSFKLGSLSDNPQLRSIANDARSRTTSPDNTDHEISHLSDLPPEHDVSGKCTRQLVSPGEQKMTTTSTDTYTEHSSEMPTMSEGEVMCSAARRRSFGETKDEAVGTKAYQEAASMSQKMELALQSIGEELARCRELLQSTHTPEIAPETRETSTTCPSRVALKHSAATPQLAQPSSAPMKCTFTLHIGTLVLSDEAVVYSRDKSLLLTWKFYDQNVSMTRVRGGRVILFDFTTEYDAVLDERFMDYLKYEEMPIIVCELEKQNFPFATCSLPFRDILNNPNHRVDMSLALTVGPDMRKAETPRSMESLVTSDEVGVLDLWCMLRNCSSSSVHKQHITPRDSCNPMLDSRSEEFGMSDEKFSQNVKAAAVTSQVLDDSSMAKYEVHNNRLSSVIPHDVPTKIRRAEEMEKAIEEKRNQPQSNESIRGLEKLEDDVLSHQPHQSVSSWARFLRRQSRFQTGNKKGRKSQGSLEILETIRNTCKPHAKINRRMPFEREEPMVDPSEDKESQQKKAVTMNVPRYSLLGWEQPQQETDKYHGSPNETIVITILWLALNEECGAMSDTGVQRLYVAFSLLGRAGADLETPVSLPKPRTYVEKCIFNFRKSIQLRQCDLPQLGHMGRCKSSDTRRHNPKDCVTFTVISEPAEDPLGLASCEDIGYAYLYFGDMLEVCDGETYVEVVPVHSARREDVVCGVLCIQVDGLDLVRKAKLVNMSH
ncbi:uncharacterized protein LOC128675116 isoform X3 [Plodia interpunctella]|uniref:uncharacterized protein LOC128675116 isoform X3 n=1 Tax=Plodia interpunctella TaxID=58824 RepID=UPI002367563F|nr:uncharacterized protein LOC128675116 isoform X3 [Plodia interpunctella]